MPLFVRTLLVTGSPADVAEAAEQHRRQIRELKAAGKIHAAGEFANGDGFLEILDVEDRLEAERIARSSPLIEAGWGTWMLREWFELDPAEPA